MSVVNIETTSGKIFKMLSCHQSWDPVRQYILTGIDQDTGFHVQYDGKDGIPYDKILYTDKMIMSTLPTQSLLSDEKILEKIHEGRIVINPFNRSNLGNCSYDVRLGSFFYRERRDFPYFDSTGTIISGNARTFSSVWEPGELIHKTPEMYREFIHKTPEIYETPYVEDIKKTQYILLEPGETILGHTEEFIGGRHNITTQLQTRSSMARIFISLCKCAGWGDIGYINRWTLEITNNSRYHNIYLRVGERVGQIVFHEVDRTSTIPYSGSYQKGSDIDDIIKNWKPEMLLPRVSEYY